MNHNKKFSYIFYTFSLLLFGTISSHFLSENKTRHQHNHHHDHHHDHMTHMEDHNGHPQPHYFQCGSMTIDQEANIQVVNEDKEIIPESTQAHSQRRRLEGLTDGWQPIRIHFDFSMLELADSMKKSFVMNDLIPASKKFFESFINLNPSTGLDFSQYDECVSLTIPQEYKTNPPAADIVIFVTAETASAGVLAWASPCLLDKQHGYRPFAGRVNFAPDKIKTEDYEWEAQLDTTLHELTHIFSLNSALFQYYVDAQGNRLAPEKISKTKTIRGVQTNMLILPKVLERARIYFDCPTLEGVELENQGSSGSKGSHWERRIWANEFMTASIMPAAKYSEMTVALYEDTGWYRPNYAVAEVMHFGYQKGCSFIDDTCIKDDQTVAFDEFCSDLNAKKCTFNTYAKGACMVSPIKADSSQFPSPTWNYFKDGTQGIDKFADNCPYAIAYSNGDCREARNDLNQWAYEESYQGDSRCFEGTYVKSEYDYAQADHVGCHSHKCEKPASLYELTITVGSESVKCYEKADTTNYKSTVQIPGYVGYLKCPDVKSFCEKNKPTGCPLQCSGRGTCNEETFQCACKSGWIGDGCEKQYCPNDCTVNGECQPDTGLCKCNTGWTKDDCSHDSTKDPDTPIDPGAGITERYKWCWADHCLQSGVYKMKWFGLTIMAIIYMIAGGINM